MAAFVSTPVVAYTTTAAWIAAPAIGSGDFAWLEVAKNEGDVRVVASFRGDRLILRSAGKTTPIVHQECAEPPCNTVQAPVTGADGSFAYAVAFPGTGGFVANVSAAGASNVVAEDRSEPSEITEPHLVATSAAAVMWAEDNQIITAPNVGGTGVVLVTAEQAGGEITSLAAGPAGVAWSAKTVAGGTLIGYRSAVGALSVRAAEPDRKVATLYSVALADDGTVVAIRRTTAKGRQQVTLTAWDLAGVARPLVASAAFGKGEPFEVTRPSVAGTRAAVRLRGGKGGTRDELWIADLATGRTARVTAVERSTARLTDPSFGAGRLVWAKDELSSRGRLLRARVYSAAVRP